MINALESRNSSGFGLLHSSVIVTSSGNPCLDQKAQAKLTGGLFYPPAEQISCIVVPFDGPEWVFRQAHSLFECCIVAADAELDFLFNQILSIQCVIERIYGKIRWD